MWSGVRRLAADEGYEHLYQDDAGDVEHASARFQTPLTSRNPAREQRLLASMSILALVVSQPGCASDSEGPSYPSSLQCSYEVIERNLGEPVPANHYFVESLSQPKQRDPMRLRPYWVDEEPPRRVVRWSDRKFPLRVSIEPPPVDHAERLEVLNSVQKAILEWSGVIDGTQPSFLFQQTSAAEIRVRWVERLPRGQLGETLILTTRSGRGFRPEAISVPDSLAGDLARLRLVLLHETGHALGIVGHSNDPADIMFAASHQSQLTLTERDRNTLRMVYACPWDGVWVPPAGVNRLRDEPGPWDRYD